MMIHYGRGIQGRVVPIGDPVSFPAFSYSRPALAPENRILPSIAGGDQPGETLIATPGSWAANPGASTTYAWEADALPIPAAVGLTYLIQLGDVGKAITVRETATNSEGTAAAVSNSITVIAP